MLAFFWLKQIIKILVLPPNGLLIVALIGLLIAARHPRRGRQIALAAVLGLIILSMPAVGALLIRSLDRTPAFDLTNPQGAQAIVILGGGTRRYAAEYGSATISGLTLERVRYGAHVARATSLPVLVSGGAVQDVPPEAVLMRNALTSEFGVPVRWAESRSRNTRENAVRSAAILKASGVQRIVLVGHSFDFPRARKEFEAAGMSVIPAPLGIPSLEDLSYGDFLPSLGGLQRSYFASYEILANALYLMMN